MKTLREENKIDDKTKKIIKEAEAEFGKRIKEKPGSSDRRRKRGLLP